MSHASWPVQVERSEQVSLRTRNAEAPPRFRVCVHAFSGSAFVVLSATFCVLTARGALTTSCKTIAHAVHQIAQGRKPRSMSVGHEHLLQDTHACTNVSDVTTALAYCLALISSSSCVSSSIASTRARLSSWPLRLRFSIAWQQCGDVVRSAATRA